jgi:hypothetical protein
LALKISFEGQGIGVSLDSLTLSKLLELLAKHNFLDFAKIRTKLGTSRELLSQSFINQEARLKPELNLYSWPNAKDQGETNGLAICARDQIARRSEFAILIFGKNRLATTIFTLLKASGFNQTKLITRSQGILHNSRKSFNKVRKVSIEQVCGLGIRSGDVGLDLETVLADLVQGCTLNPSGFGAHGTFPEIPSFIISTERAQSDYVQRWMSEGIPYLLISDLIESQIEIGPLVIPGKSPCAFCLDLWRSENNPIVQKLELLNSLNEPLEIPASAASAIAGLVVLQTAQFAASGKSRLIGSCVRFNLHEPCYPESAHFRAHSGCGCQY